MGYLGLGKSIDVRASYNMEARKCEVRIIEKKEKGYPKVVGYYIDGEVFIKASCIEKADQIQKEFEPLKKEVDEYISMWK